jgi:LAS superfamily LD-carboxypeptidase LdcB
MLNEFELTGRAWTHVVQMQAPRFAALPEVATAFLEMRAAAAEHGFDLIPFSTFRDFDTQLRIWNDKFSGKKTLYDRDGKPLDFASLSPPEIVRAILYWSALPGASRHHWGTEIDVVDAAAMPDGYSVKLLPEETQPGGLFHPLHQWLDGNIARFGFFRPYARYVGGMFPEPWHLSYAPISTKLIDLMSPQLLRDAIGSVEASDMLGKDLVLDMIPSIYEDQVMKIVRPDAQ